MGQGRWVAGGLVLVLSLGCLSEPPPPAPPPEPEPTGPVESLGGVVQGKAFDSTSFVCTGPSCEKQAEVAGESGTLLVSLCEGKVNQIAFREDFYAPDVVAARLGKRNKGDGSLWTAHIGQALKEVGFAMREPAPEELAEMRKALGPSQAMVGSKVLEEPSYLFFDHPDGRKRVVSLLELPAPPEALAVDPQAALIRVTLSTMEAKVCTAGM
jgi:hypothetical protein